MYSPNVVVSAKLVDSFTDCCLAAERQPAGLLPLLPRHREAGHRVRVLPRLRQVSSLPLSL